MTFENCEVSLRQDHNVDDLGVTKHDNTALEGTVENVRNVSYFSERVVFCVLQPIYEEVEV